MHHHPGLGKRKGQESSNGVKRNEPVCYPAKKNQQPGSEKDQPVDAGGVQQTPTAQGEEVGQIVIEGHRPREPGKICKGGVCRERKHQQDGGNGHVVENSPSCNGGGQLREHALVAGSFGVGGADAIGLAHKRNAQQQHDEQGDDDG